MTRRILLCAALGGAICLVSGWFAAPGIIAAKLREKAEAKGLRLLVQDVDLAWSGLQIGSLEVLLPSEPKPLFRGQGVAVNFRWWDVTSGPSALRKLVVEAASIELTPEDLKRLLTLGKSNARQAKPEELGASRELGLPAVQLEKLEIRLSDHAGALVHARGASVHVEGSAWNISVGNFELGGAPHDAVQVTGLKASGTLHGMRPTLKEASGQSATLAWETSGGAEERAPGPSTISRFLDLRQALRGETTAGTEALLDKERAKLWAPDARIDLRNIQVVEAVAAGGKAAPILDGLDVSLQAQGDNALRVTGKGNAPGSGHVAWDLTAVPSEARVEGSVSLQDVSLALFGPVLPPLPFSDLERTRVRAELELTGLGLESVAVKGNLALSDLAFASEGLAKAPVGPLDFTMQGEGTWTPARRELSGLRAKLKSGATAISLSGMLAWPKDGYRIDVVAELPKTRCGDVLTFVPAGLLDELATVKLGGNLTGKLTFHVDAANLDATKVDFDVKDACTFDSLLPMLDLRRFARPFLHQVLEPDGTLFEMETGPGSISWTPIEHVSPFFIQAVIAHEDGRFFTHHGFAEPEIGVALARNLKAKAFKFGASTITMQLVKNVFLHRDKLLARKVQEAFIVWWLEQQWDKRRILELYLNVIEYGPKIYGIRNAALHYFGTLPIYLTPAQAGFLACVLPSPKSSYVHYEKKALSTSARNRIANLLKHMSLRERIDAEALAYGLEELERFRFYDPKEPPPVPPEVRGTAQKPPFKTTDVIVDPWENYVPSDDGKENGGFGQP